MAFAWLTPLANAGAAPAPADFYAGKTVAIVVGSPPIGGRQGLAQTLGRVAGASSDGAAQTYAQMLARFLGAHLPGAPRVVVRDLPDGSGLAALLYLEHAAAADGGVLATFDPSVITRTILGGLNGRSALAGVAWIGAMAPDVQVCYVRRAAGVATWSDLATGRDLAFGATAPSDPSDVGARLLRTLFARKIRPILGYPSQADIYFAIARGELDGACGPLAGLPARWLRDNAISVFVRLTAAAAPGAERTPYLGAFATSEAQRRIVDLLGGAGALGHPLIVSRQAPRERIQSLRDAFDATMRDPEFLRAAAGLGLAAAPTSGAAADRIFVRLDTAPPDLVRQARAAIE